MLEAAMFQIHQQKRQIVEDVDAREAFVELQAIEKGRPAVDEANIPEMQIAMAMAHLAGRPPPVEQLRQDGDPFLPLLEKALHSIPAEPGSTRGCEAAILHLGKVGHLDSATAVNMPLGGSVKPGNMVGQLIHYSPIEAARFGEGIEEQGLIEASHHDDPIESLAVRRKADGVVRAAEEAANLLIKRGRRAPVQDQLRLASSPPEIRGRKIEIGVGYRALQLENAVARDENQRSVGFDDFDAIHSRTIGGRIL
jgi:hypothetical protein